MANAHEAARDDVEQKASHTFVGGERHDLPAVVVGVVPPVELDAAVAVIDQSIIRERDAVRVPTQVVEHLLGAGEGLLRLHDPVDGPQPPEETGEGLAMGEIGGATSEGQLAGVERTPQASQILRTKDHRQRPDRKQEGGSPRDPPRAVSGQGAPRDETMEMEVLREGLAPGVEHRGDADRAAQMPRVAPEGEQRVGGRAEEQRVEHARIALRAGVEGVGHGEDHVKVRDRQEVGFARGEPPFLGERLTLRTMAIAAGVVRDAYGAAAVTRLPVPAERGSAAALDRAERHDLDLGEPVRALKRVPVRTHDVRQLKPGQRDGGHRAPRGHGAHGQAGGRGGRSASNSSRAACVGNAACVRCQ